MRDVRKTRRKYGTKIKNGTYEYRDKKYTFQREVYCLSPQTKALYEAVEVWGWEQDEFYVMPKSFFEDKFSKVKAWEK